jgi:hypothetical protein
MYKKIIFIVLILNCTIVSAGPSWYQGTINRVLANGQDGSFIITFNSDSSLNGCKYEYIYFHSKDLQPEKLKSTFSLAISAYHTGSTVGVVINKGADGETCYASSADLRK